MKEQYKRGSSINLLFAFMILLWCMHCDMPQDRGSYADPQVLLITELGDIVLEIYVRDAPVTARNFLRYVDENRFREARFYRTVTPDNQPDNDIRIEVIQGGIGFIESELRLPMIVHETTNRTGIRHRDGVISMARAEVGTADSEFFICIGDQPELDYGGKRNPDGQGYAAFGRVIAGMETVRLIHQEPADVQMLIVPVRILYCTRVNIQTGSSFKQTREQR
jgi:peptidyl-prolyl cis-trans isomerase A (cyclophilin A)